MVPLYVKKEGKYDGQYSSTEIIEHPFTKAFLKAIITSTVVDV